MDRTQLLAWFEQMLLLRRFEEKAAEMYAYGKIGGFLHLYIGEEAVAVGAMAALRPDDDVLTHYRDHGYILARGTEPGPVMAELFGKRTGVSGGKGGSMHLADVKRHFWGGHAIVGGHLPVAAGLALAHQYKGEDKVCVCVFGEGATNIGDFHEALNLSAVWKLPMIWLCENNAYGMGTAVGRASAVTDIVKKARAYDMSNESIDGNDPVAVYEAMQRATAQCRSGQGPYFLEAHTYRFRGHSMADPELYRSKEEVEAMKARDPLELFATRIGVTPEERDRIGLQVEALVEQAAQFAEESPWPDESDLWANVVAQPVGR